MNTFKRDRTQADDSLEEAWAPHTVNHPTLGQETRADRDWPGLLTWRRGLHQGLPQAAGTEAPWGRVPAPLGTWADSRSRKCSGRKKALTGPLWGPASPFQESSRETPTRPCRTSRLETSSAPSHRGALRLWLSHGRPKAPSQSWTASTRGPR